MSKRAEELVKRLRNNLFDNPCLRDPGNKSYREGYEDGLNDMADEFIAALHEYGYEVRRRSAEICREKETYAMPIPCPDGIPGCCVAHFVEGRRQRDANGCAAAIEQEKLP